jgi:sulfite reductase beta subunit-like hemoprotein
VTVIGDESWLDGDDGRLVRPYTVSNGRTHPTNSLDLLSMVMATGGVAQSRLEPDHAQALALCHQPASVAEIAARLRLPAMVTKVLVSDLVDCGAVTTRPPRPESDPTDRFLLERVLDALQRRL